MNTLEHQVVVVGAGPVGLVTAIGLAQHGIKVLVLEQNSSEVPPQWRGSTIHPPTLEIFDDLGLAEHIIKGAIKVEVLQFRDLEIPLVVNFNYDQLNGKVKFPFRLQYEQYKVLKLLRDTAATNPNIEIRYEVEVLGVTQTIDDVTLELRQNLNTSQIKTNWLVGADGSHSKVRKSLDIELEGFTYPYPTTVVATPYPFEDHIADLAPVSYWSGPLGRLSMIRTPDIWRIAMTTKLEGIDLSSDDRGTIDEPTTEFKDAILLLLANIPDAKYEDLQLKQYEVYRSHQRVAKEFSKGRVALAGDAAHLTTTNGGMGLNSGVQDASALVKYLCFAISENSLDPIRKYGLERKAFCDLILQPTTTSNHESVDNPDHVARAIRLQNLFVESNNPELELKMVSKASMLTQISQAK